jgi:hypothetical protein
MDISVRKKIAIKIDIVKEILLTCPINTRHWHFMKRATTGGKMHQKMSKEKKKRTLLTSYKVYDVIKEKKTQKNQFVVNV